MTTQRSNRRSGGDRETPRHVGLGRLRRNSPPNWWPRSDPCWSKPPASARATGCWMWPQAPETRPSRRHRPEPASSPATCVPSCCSPGPRIAAEQGVELEWREANAHALPFGDNEFDVVMSCIGVMFAPFHRAVRRRADPGVQAGRPDRADQLDARGLHRSALRHHEAVRAAPAAGCAAAPAVGSRGPRPRAARRPSHRRC